MRTLKINLIEPEKSDLNYNLDSNLHISLTSIDSSSNDIQTRKSFKDERILIITDTNIANLRVVKNILEYLVLEIGRSNFTFTNDKFSINKFEFIQVFFKTKGFYIPKQDNNFTLDNPIIADFCNEYGIKMSIIDPFVMSDYIYPLKTINGNCDYSTVIYSIKVFNPLSDIIRKICKDYITDKLTNNKKYIIILGRDLFNYIPFTSIYTKFEKCLSDICYTEGLDPEIIMSNITITNSLDKNIIENGLQKNIIDLNNTKLINIFLAKEGFKADGIISSKILDSDVYFLNFVLTCGFDTNRYGFTKYLEDFCKHVYITDVDFEKTEEKFQDVFSKDYKMYNFIPDNLELVKTKIGTIL